MIFLKQDLSKIKHPSLLKSYHAKKSRKEAARGELTIMLKFETNYSVLLFKGEVDKQ